MKKILLVFSLLFLQFSSSFAQEWLWGEEGYTGNKAYGSAPSVATDNKGNVWHVGFFLTTLTIGSNILTSSGQDAFLVKYDNNGNLLWVKQSVVSSGPCHGQYVATDDSGNAYITGNFKAASVQFGTFTLTGSTTHWTIFMVKYDKNGNVIWAKQSTTSGSASGYGQSVACDGKGYEYLTGYLYSGSLSFGAYTVTSTNPAEFLAKYDYNGNVLWASQSTGTADSTYANSVAVSRTGDEYVAGFFNGTPTFGSNTLNASYYDIFLTKYDPNGNVLWAEQSHGNNTNTSTSSCDVGMSVAADIYDNVYMTGFFADNLSFEKDTVKHDDTLDMFYAKFAPNGHLNWLKEPGTFNGKHDRWYGNCVSTDAENHFYLCGTESPGIGIAVENGDIVFSPDTLFGTVFTPYWGGEGQSVLVKFDSAGNALCGSIFDDNIETDFSSCSINGVASDSAGNYVYMGGVFGNANVTLGTLLYYYNLGDLPYTARWIGCSDLIASIVSTPINPCAYNCNASATVTISGGSPPFTYVWNTGQTTSSISGLCAGTYSVIVTDSSGYKSIETVIIKNPTGSLTITHSDDSICTGGSVTLNASGIKTYNWFPTTGLSCNTCPNPTATPTATTTYYVTGQDTDHFGCIDTLGITIIVTPKPTITITQETSSCSAEILLIATGATTYDWLPSTFLSCSTCAETYATPTVTTTYTVIGSNNGCPDTTTVTVSPLSIKPFDLKVSAPHDTICRGDTVQLTASGTNIKTWDWTPATGLSCTACPNPKAYPSVTTTYYVYAYDSAGCDTEMSITIKVGNHFPAITASPDSICVGDSTRLIATGDNTYLWNTLQTSDTIWVKPTTSTSYTVTGTESGCVNSTSIIVNVTPPPVITISPNDTICEGKSVNISASGASTYSWLPTTGLSCNNCPNPTATPTATTTYTVTGTSTIGCVGTNTITIVVTPPPVASIIATKDTVCAGDSVLLIGNGGGTYKWSTTGTTDSIYVKPTSVSTYTLIVFKNGCSDTASKTIQVFSSGSASISLSKDSICSGDSTVLTVSGASTFKWSNGATTSTIKVAPGSTETYTVTTYSQCDTNTLIKTVHIIQYPTPAIFGKTSICSGKKDTLTASGGTTYKWSTGATTSTIYPVITGTTTITLTSSNGTCSKDTSIVLTILPSPTVTVNSPAPMCAGDSTTLTATGGGTYRWSTGSTDSTIYVAPTSTTTYTVTVTNSLGCSTASTTAVTIVMPIIYACCDSTILKGSNVILYADSSYTYKWYPSTGISCDTCPSVTVSPSVTTTYTVVGTDKEGCEVSRVITVVVEPPCADFFVPNVFTPTVDGINSQFFIKTEDLSSYSIIIYDRWGKEMYKSTDPTVGWNGNTESGGPAPTGVYYYIIKSTCMGTEYNKDGFLQLIR